MTGPGPLYSAGVVTGADLDAALAGVLGDVSGARLREIATALTDAYRSDGPPGEVLTSPLAARAYAAYRMPATFAAVRAALRGPTGLRPADAARPRRRHRRGGLGRRRHVPSPDRGTVLDGPGRRWPSAARSPRTRRPRCWPARPGPGQPRRPPSCRPPTWSRLAYVAGRAAGAPPAAPPGARPRPRPRPSRWSSRARRPAPAPAAGSGRLAGQGFPRSRPVPARPHLPVVRRPGLVPFRGPAAPVDAAPSGQGRPTSAGRTRSSPTWSPVRTAAEPAGGPDRAPPVPAQGSGRARRLRDRPAWTGCVSKRRGAAYRAARDAGWGDPWPPHP